MPPKNDGEPELVAVRLALSALLLKKLSRGWPWSTPITRQVMELRTLASRAVMDRTGKPCPAGAATPFRTFPRRAAGVRIRLLCRHFGVGPSRLRRSQGRRRQKNLILDAEGLRCSAILRRLDAGSRNGLVQSVRIRPIRETAPKPEVGGQCCALRLIRVAVGIAIFSAGRKPLAGWTLWMLALVLACSHRRV